MVGVESQALVEARVAQAAEDPVGSLNRDRGPRVSAKGELASPGVAAKHLVRRDRVAAKVCPPIRRLRQLDLTEDEIGQPIQQIVLVSTWLYSDIASTPQAWPQPSHAQPFEAVAVSDRNGRGETRARLSDRRRPLSGLVDIRVLHSIDKLTAYAYTDIVSLHCKYETGC